MRAKASLLRGDNVTEPISYFPNFSGSILAQWYHCITLLKLSLCWWSTLESQVRMTTNEPLKDEITFQLSYKLS